MVHALLLSADASRTNARTTATTTANPPAPPPPAPQGLVCAGSQSSNGRCWRAQVLGTHKCCGACQGVTSRWRHLPAQTITLGTMVTKTLLSIRVKGLVKFPSNKKGLLPPTFIVCPHYILPFTIFKLTPPRLNHIQTKGGSLYKLFMYRCTGLSSRR